MSWAVRGLQQLSHFGWAVWTPTEVAATLRDGVALLGPGQACRHRCGGAAPRRVVSTFDASRAFEMAPEDEVLEGMSAVWEGFRRETGRGTVSVFWGRPPTRLRCSSTAADPVALL